MLLVSLMEIKLSWYKNNLEINLIFEDNISLLELNIPKNPCHVVKDRMHIQDLQYLIKRFATIFGTCCFLTFTFLKNVRFRQNMIYRKMLWILLKYT